MMYEDLTPEAMNTLVLKTLEKLSEEKKKSLAHIKHFIFAHENQRLLIRFWEIIDEQLRSCPTAYILMGSSLTNYRDP